MRVCKGGLSLKREYGVMQGGASCLERVSIAALLMFLLAMRACRNGFPDWSSLSLEGFSKDGFSPSSSL